MNSKNWNSPTSICNRCPAVGKAIAEAKKNKAATPALRRRTWRPRSRRRSIATSAVLSVTIGDATLGYSLLRNRTALATEGSHDIAWHQRNPFVLPLLGLGCGCLAGDGFCAARLSDARFANDLGWRSRGPSLQDKEIKYLLAVRGAIQTALELTSYQTRCARTLKRLRRAPPIITPRLGDGRAGLPCSQ